MSTVEKYTKDHEVIRVEDGDVAVIGITAYAQDALGDLVFVELPDTGKALSKGDECAVVESVKTAAEVYTPVSGEIIAVNDNLSDDPEAIKISLDEGWIVKIKMTNPDEISELMDDEAYKKFCDELDD